MLFDLDGTLVDTLAICFLGFRRAVESAGGPALSDADIYALFGPSEDGMMQRVLPDGWERALPAYFDEYARLLPTCSPVAADLTASLGLIRRRGIKTALVTGKARTTALMSLRHFGLDAMFDAVETGSPEGVVKARAIRRVLERWRLEPEQAVYLGDGVADVLAAREAGVVAAGAAWAFGGRAADLKGAGADVIFTDTSDFGAWIDAQTRAAR